MAPLIQEAQLEEARR